MTQGVLLFAHNNEQINYLLLAYWQSLKIRQYLDRPCSVVTDQSSIDSLNAQGLDPTTIFDQIIITSGETLQKKNYCGQRLTFKNVDRCSAFMLTPYEETIVIDTDILIQSNRLNLLWNNEQDILVCKNSLDIFQRRYTAFEKLSNYGIDFYWATVFYFKKNRTAEIFFQTLQKISSMYNWYAHAYDIDTNYKRNDFIWSIALNELNYPGAVIPFNLFHCLDTDQLVNLSGNTATFHNKKDLVKIADSDVHVMNKFDLIKFVKKELQCEDI